MIYVCLADISFILEVSHEHDFFFCESEIQRNYKTAWFFYNLRAHASAAIIISGDTSLIFSKHNITGFQVNKLISIKSHNNKFILNVVTCH